MAFTGNWPSRISRVLSSSMAIALTAATRVATVRLFSKTALAATVITSNTGSPL